MRWCGMVAAQRGAIVSCTRFAEWVCARARGSSCTSPLLPTMQVRRFITLVDALYEKKVKVIVHAAAPPQMLFRPEGHNVECVLPAAAPVARSSSCSERVPVAASLSLSQTVGVVGVRRAAVRRGVCVRPRGVAAGGDAERGVPHDAVARGSDAR